jgi:hypothetical protein
VQREQKVTQELREQKVTQELQVLRSLRAVCAERTAQHCVLSVCKALVVEQFFMLTLKEDTAILII